VAKEMRQGHSGVTADRVAVNAPSILHSIHQFSKSNKAKKKTRCNWGRKMIESTDIEPPVLTEFKKITPGLIKGDIRKY
jgi:hypothetical protein